MKHEIYGAVLSHPRPDTLLESGLYCVKETGPPSNLLF